MSWPVATVGEVCEVVSGATPRTGKPEFWDGNVPWVTPKDLSELGQKHLSDTPRKITKAGLKSCSARMLPAQSVLFSSRAPIGLVAINTIPVCTNQGFKSLVPRFDLVSPDFLFWWLKAQEKHVQSKGRGATFKEVSKKIVEDLQIPLPPLAEQKRIAAILDAADALRAKRREALAQLDTLLQSTFLDMFGDPVTNPMGWEVQRLADVFWLQEGPGVRNWQFKESGIKLLNVSNILKSGELDLSKTDRHLSTDEAQEKYSHFLVDQTSLESSTFPRRIIVRLSTDEAQEKYSQKNFLVDADDLVIASSGIPIDEDDLLRTRSAFVRDEHLPLCMNTSTVRFKATDGISDLRFLQQWLQSHEFRRQITREVTGSAQKNFGPTHLNPDFRYGCGNRQDQAPRLDFWGSDIRNHTTEGDTLWVNYTTSHFSSRSTVS